MSAFLPTRDANPAGSSSGTGKTSKHKPVESPTFLNALETVRATADAYRRQALGDAKSAGSVIVAFLTISWTHAQVLLVEFAANKQYKILYYHADDGLGEDAFDAALLRSATKKATEMMHLAGSKDNITFDMLRAEVPKIKDALTTAGEAEVKLDNFVEDQDLHMTLKLADAKRETTSLMWRLGRLCDGAIEEIRANAGQIVALEVAGTSTSLPGVTDVIEEVFQRKVGLITPPSGRDNSPSRSSDRAVDAVVTAEETSAANLSKTVFETQWGQVVTVTIGPPASDNKMRSAAGTERKKKTAHDTRTPVANTTLPAPVQDQPPPSVPVVNTPAAETVQGRMGLVRPLAEATPGNLQAAMTKVETQRSTLAAQADADFYPDPDFLRLERHSTGPGISALEGLIALESTSPIFGVTGSNCVAHMDSTRPSFGASGSVSVSQVEGTGESSFKTPPRKATAVPDSEGFVSPEGKGRRAISFEDCPFPGLDTLVKSLKKQRVSPKGGKGSVTCATEAQDYTQEPGSSQSRTPSTSGQESFHTPIPSSNSPDLVQTSPPRRIDEKETSTVSEADDSHGVGKYTTVKEFARTNHSVLYTATDPMTGKEVIMKRAMVKHDLPRRLRDEITIHKELQGSGIVELVDSFEDDGMPYLVMEKMEADLKCVLDETQSFSEEDRKAYMRMALTSLKTMHDKDIIHTDIKPDNFLYSHGVGVKLTDFGNATREGHPRDDCMPYVRAYRPQEVFLDSSKTSKASDMWAMGLIHQDLIRAKYQWAQPVTDFEQLRNITSVQQRHTLFKTEQFRKLSLLEHDFLGRLVEMEAQDRMTVDEALSHPWFSTDKPQTPLDKLQAVSYKKPEHGKRKRRHTMY